MAKHELAQALTGDAGRDSAFSLWLARLGLLATVGWLLARGVLGQMGWDAADISGWEKTPLVHLRAIAKGLVLAGVFEACLFFIVGLLVPMALGRFPANRFLRSVVVSIIGVGIAIGVRSVEVAGVPSGAHLVVPLLAFVLGAWIASAWRRGLRAFLWLVPQLGVLLLLLAAGAIALAWLAIESDPLPVAHIPVTPAERRQLAETLRGKRTDGEGPRRVVFTQTELNQLLAATVPRISPHSAARVQFAGDMAEVELSLPLPHRWANQAYANVRVVGNLTIADGDVTVDLESGSIGRLAIPPAILRFCAPLVAATIRGDRELGIVLNAIQSLRMEDIAIVTTIKPGAFEETVIPALARKLSGRAEVVVETRDQVRHLLAATGELPPGDARFAALIERAFGLARERSVDNDPMLENRAAILALAILLGHERVEPLVGEVTDESSRELAARDLKDVTLRNRADWTRHFFVSAAITLLSSEQTSDAVGVLKESLDAEEGKSGFSFSDLAADRAGTLFALAATGDVVRARAMQERFAKGVSVDDLFPPAADLPEGISAEDLKSQYGGVDGPGYKRVVDDIEARLAECAALH